MERSAQGYTPAPRLAGQRSEYLENQLMNFRAHTRDIRFQNCICGVPQQISVLRRCVIWQCIFRRYLLKRPMTETTRLVARGRTIYQEGVPDSNIVACVACHGPNAEGVREIPRLGGLAYSYLKRRLEQWGEGYHAAAGPPMPHIAGNLSPNQIEALASYLSFIK